VSPTLPRRGAPLRLAAAAIVLALSAGIAAPTQAQAQTYETLEGTGSTWSQNALLQWARDVAPAGIRVQYSGSGSTAGRNDFRQGLNDFGVTEIPYGDRDRNGTVEPPPQRTYAYLPYVAGGTALSYQLRVGGQQVTNLRLSGETVAKIFTNQITNWNDPAIAKDNNGRVLPSLTIRPVVRAEGSGTTAQFTAYLDARYPGIWQPFNGSAGRTSQFPAQRPMIAASGSDGVMNTITASSGNGSIGYIEYSYATNARFPVVKLLNEGGFYTEPSDRNVAVALQAATINADLTQELGRVYVNPDKRAYPMSSYSYLLIPTSKSDKRLNANKAQTLADYISYSICEGQASAGRLGYSPLPLNLAQAGFEQVAKFKSEFPGINLAGRDVTKCNNPTFFAGDLNRNRLAEEAPQPAPCDAVGQGPCGSGTGGAAGNPNPPGNSGNKAPDNPPGTAPGGSAGATVPSATGPGVASSPASSAQAPGSAPAGALSAAPPTGAGGVAASATDPATGLPAVAVVDPDTGLPAAGATAGGAALSGTPTELAANRTTGMAPTLGTLAAAELLLLLIVPALVARSISRRRLRDEQ
jgi:phosphate transport system substrate-binding protein